MMAAERQFWFGFSLSNPDSIENRNNKFVKASETQTIGDLVARESGSIPSNLILDKIEASKAFILKVPDCKDYIDCDSSMPAGVLYNDFGIRYIYARLKKTPTEGESYASSSCSSSDLPSGLDYLMKMQKKYDRLPSTRY